MLWTSFGELALRKGQLWLLAITGAAGGISAPQAHPGRRVLPAAAALLGAPTAAGLSWLLGVQPSTPTLTV